MPNSKKKTVSVFAGNYTFIFSEHRLIAASRLKSNKNEEALKAIARAYEEYKRVVKPAGRLLSGEWRWCMNPECYNAFYALRFRIKKGHGLFCSHSCTGKVLRAQKRKRIGRPKVAKAVR